MMNKQVFLEEQLYYLTYGGHNPFKLNNEFVLVYSDYEKIELAKKKFNLKYGNVDILSVNDKTSFVKQMITFGCLKFVYNGESEVYDFKDFYDGQDLAEIMKSASPIQTVQNISPQYIPVQHTQIQVIKKSKNADYSLICGIVAMILPFPVLTVLALVLGIVSVCTSKKEGAKAEGRAIAGIVLGGVQVLYWIGIIVMMFVYIATEV